MKINLHRRYRGRLTNEQWIEHGVQDVEASLAKYLVDNGHAIAIARDVMMKPEPADETALTEREQLEIEYELATGNKAPWNAKDETLIARIQEANDS